ncbi:MAG: hypothetical protein AAFX99_05250 [Myxococcota bacterium]
MYHTTLTSLPSSSHVLVLAAGLVLGTIATVSISAIADGDPTTDQVPRMFPYQGYMELDGVPLNTEALDMTFALYDGAEAVEPVYRQDLTVEVYAGRFTASIGPVGRGPNNEDVFIEQVIANADDLHLGITLLGSPEDPEDDIELSNRQRLHASPYAIWTTSATNLNVANNITIDGAAQIRDGLTVDGAAQIGDDLTVDESVHVRNNLRVDGATNVDNLIAEGTISGDFELTLEDEIARQQNNSNGSQSAVLGAANGRRFCFLTGVGFRDLDADPERGDCRVVIEQGNWRVRASLTTTPDADAYCSARCISW